MEMVATGNSSGHANAFTDTKIKMRDSLIQVRSFDPTGRLALWRIGIMGLENQKRCIYRYQQKMVDMVTIFL
jgi:hypothetical protein